MKVIARSSNLIKKITILVVVGLCVNTAVALDGSGTEEDSWLIQSLEDFNDFAADANYWDDYTRLETDVNLAGRVYSRAVIAPDVNDEEIGHQGTAFTGVFDGNDHKILNLAIDDGGAGNNYLGLFGYINGGEVRNLGLEGGSVSGYYSVGGLVGQNYFGTVSNCYSTGDVNGVTYVGGLMGLNEEGTITKSYSTGSVSGSSKVGGLVGTNNDIVSNCYSTGDVNGFVSIGGLMGWNGRGDVSNCYSTGYVSGGDTVGGLMGDNGRGRVSNCFWNTETSGQDYSDGGTGLPTAQMQTRSTFTDADWDFINVWNIGENQTYPYLRIYLPSDINKDGIVNFLDVAITANQWMQGVQ